MEIAVLFVQLASVYYATHAYAFQADGNIGRVLESFSKGEG